MQIPLEGRQPRGKRAFAARCTACTEGGALPGYARRNYPQLAYCTLGTLGAMGREACLSKGRT